MAQIVGREVKQKSKKIAAMSKKSMEFNLI